MRRDISGRQVGGVTEHSWGPAKHDASHVMRHCGDPCGRNAEMTAYCSYYTSELGAGGLEMSRDGALLQIHPLEEEEEEEDSRSLKYSR